MAQKLSEFMITFVALHKVTHRRDEGLSKEEDRVNADGVTQHKIHEESRHQNAELGTGCQLHQFLHDAKDTLSSISRLRTVSTLGAVESVENPNGSSSCSYCFSCREDPSARFISHFTMHT